MDLIVDFPQGYSNIGPLHQEKEKKVTFANNADLYLIDRITEHLWIPAHEKETTKGGVVTLLRSLNRVGMTLAQYAEWCVTSGEDTSNFMGLEHHFSLEAIRQIRLRRRQVWDAVMMEQRRQNDAGIYDPDEMRCVSFDITEHAQERSFVIGLLHTDNRDEMGLSIESR